MSVQYRVASDTPRIAASSPALGRVPPWAVAVAAVTLLLPILLVRASQAQPAPPHRVLDAEATRRIGLELKVVRKVVGRQLLVTIGGTRGGTGSGGPVAGQPYLLAAGPGGDRLAMADVLGLAGSQLIISRPNGGVSITALAGVLGAQFSPDGEWVAAIDASGAVWRVAAASGEGQLIADGPFAGEIEFGLDGLLLLLAVNSIDAPTTSAPVLVDPGTGEVEAVEGAGDESLVYRARHTAEGVAIVAHRPDGSKVIRLLGEAPRQIALLPSAAGSADVSPDLTAVAYRLAGERRVVLIRADGTSRAFEVDGRPLFAPDGTSLLTTAADRAATIDPQSGDVTSLVGQAVWAACAGECRP